MPIIFTPRAILDSPASILAGTAFLAAGWSVTTPVSRAAFGGHPLEILRATANLTFEFGDNLDRDMILDSSDVLEALPGCISLTCQWTASYRRSSVTLDFATAADMVACLASPAGQTLLATIASGAAGETAARIACGPTRSPATGQSHFEIPSRLAAD